MSSRATKWAFDQRGLPALVKLVLLVMADSAGQDGSSYCSCQTLCHMSGISKVETISSIQDEMCKLGLMADSGKRVGNTRRIKVYQFPKEACAEEHHDDEGRFECFFKYPANTPSDGVLKNGLISPESSGNIPVISPESSAARKSPIIEGTLNLERGTLNENIQEARARWIQEYEKATGDKYVRYSRKLMMADSAAMKGLLEGGLTVERIVELTSRFLANKKCFWSSRVRTIQQFAEHIQDLINENTNGHPFNPATVADKQAEADAEFDRLDVAPENRW